MYRPDYRSGGIVNLMASVSLGLGGGRTGYDPLPELKPARLADRPVVLLLVDGLGYEGLMRRGPGLIAEQTVARLTSVFPSSTASAITSLATGTAPQQHGITGWFTYFRELGSVATTLPYHPRHGGGSYSADGIAPNHLIGASPLYDRLAVPCHVVSPSHIIDSDYTRATAGLAQRHGHRSLEELFAIVSRLVREGRPCYVFAYWTELDALCHRFGSGGAPVQEHLQELESALKTFIQSIRGSGALVLVTADHGMVDTTAEHTLFLDRHPRLSRCLTLPLCGEPRAVFCYVRASRREEFVAYVEGELREACRLMQSEQLVEEGYLGWGTPHDELLWRIGDYTLLMNADYILRDRLPMEKAFNMIGVHGGTHPDELFVPLALFEP